MDIKFHVNKIIKSGGDADDWLYFIDRLKNIRTDRDLLMQIYTVALKNLKKEATVGYKKLMIGLANLQSEVSFDLARETYLDAKALDLECAVVCVYYAQFEYLHQHKDKARHIIHAAKQNGCFPKYILKQAYQNCRQNKLSLLDGISDPWTSFGDGTDEQTGGSHVSDTSENIASQVFGTTHANHSQAIATDLITKTLAPPTRAISKSKSASNIITSKSKWHTTPRAADVEIVKSTLNKKDSGGIIGNNNGNHNKPFERHGPGMSPFIKSMHSPLVNRKFDLNTMPADDGIFGKLFSSVEKCPFVTPIKNRSRSGESGGSENDDVCGGSSDSCTSRLFTTNVLKEHNSDFQKYTMKKSISSPCIFQGNRNTFSEVNLVLDNQLESVSKMVSGTNKNSKTILNSEEMHHATVQRDINVFDVPRGVFYKKNNSKSEKENNSLINHGGTAFINTVDVNHGVNTQRSTKVQLSLLSPSQNDILYHGGNTNSESGNEKSLSNNVATTNSMSERSTQSELRNLNRLNVENNNVDKQKIDSNEICYKKTNDESVFANKICNSGILNVFAINEMKKLGNANKCKVGNNQIPDDTIKDSTKHALKVDESSNDKVTGSDMFSEDIRKNTVCTSFPLGVHDYPGQISTTYTVKGIRYHRMKILGKGGSCKVYEVLSEHGETYALKKVGLRDVDDFMLNMYKNEIKWLEKMKGSRHIITLFDWEIKNEALFLLLEKGDSDLAHTLKYTKTLPREVMKDYWKQIITAVKIIHDNGIVHTDLKPANFLLVGKMLKLIDFGIANSIQDNKTSVTMECQVGTLNYMSPEALVQDGCRISRASDVWSLGCVLYYMIYKKTPYSDIKNQYSRFFALQQGQPIDYTGVDDKLLLDCLQGCLKHDKKDRYSIQQLLAHPYLN